MEEFFETVKKASRPGIWSQGVKLARDRAVIRVASSPVELTVRVRTAGRALAPTVTLHLEEHEWACDCNSEVDPCAHVAAAAIAASQGLLEAAPEAVSPGVAPPGFVPAMRLVYRLRTEGRRLMLSRVIVRKDGKEARLTRNLAESLRRGILPADLEPTHADLEVERLLGAPANEVVRPAVVADVFRALSSDADVTLNGKPAKISADRVAPRATVEDAPDGGFVLRMESDPSVTEVVAMGVVRCGDTLCAIAEGETTGYYLERLPVSRVFAATDEAELVTRVLPELERRVTLVLQTTRLRGTTREAEPRITMDLSHHGHTLSVLPKLVYGDPPIARIDGDTVVLLDQHVPVRKLDAERALLRRLRDELHLIPGRRVDLDGADAMRFADKLRKWQERDRAEGEDELFRARPLTVRLDVTDGRFDVAFLTEPADGEEQTPPRRAETAAVLRAFRDGLSLVPLDGGGWAPLPVDWLEKYGDRVAALLEARDEERKVPVAVLPELGALCEALNMPKPLGLERLEPLLAGFSGIPAAQLPAGLNATLRNYQRVGVDWLAFLREAGLGAVLADDMGLGKTLQALCAFEGRTLVVCPKSVVYNWAAEIARFRPGLRVATYHGAGRELDAAADVTLTTYSVLRLDVDRLRQQKWSAVVLDEAQAIKNATSQTAQAAFQLKGEFRVALSGTPVENRLEELWSVMHFANPGLLGGRSSFQERYAGPIASGNAEAGARLRAKIRPFVLRRLKRDVVPELPPRTDSILHVELDETERSVYDAIRLTTRREVVERLAKGGGIMAALEALLRLRQAACHPKLVPGQQGETSSKVERLLEALEEVVADGHKAIVFSQWTSLLDLVEPHLHGASMAFTRLDGTTVDRGAVVTKFQTDASCPILLASLKAGGTGLNLTAADHVFLLDPWWNPAVEEQAADRAHRIGQERPVIVYRMVAKDTVEEGILALQAKKRALTDVALGDANHGGGITRDELLALLA